MRSSAPPFISGLLAGLLLLTALPPPSRAWTGVELDLKVTGVSDPFEVPGPAGDGGAWELGARVMHRAVRGGFGVELHWLGTALGTYGDAELPSSLRGSAFRRVDLERVHQSGERGVLVSEMDRLALSYRRAPVALTVGRQGLSWGEAYYYNVGDLFGAFPVVETNRLHKPGIDAVTAVLETGVFSELALAAVPVKEGDDGGAARFLFPLGDGAAAITAGSVQGGDVGGFGYSMDVSGTKLYGTYLWTFPEDGGGFSETVVGLERQMDPLTHLLVELYRNGWGATDPGEYASLALSERALRGLALTLGRYNGAVQVTRSLTPLLTVSPALFANLSDGSALLRMNGTLSLSDLAQVSGGAFAGLGERPDGPVMNSEFGTVPLTVYLELVVSY